MTLVYAYQDRNTTRDIVIQDADGNTITPSSTDLIRARIGRIGEPDQLSVTSGSPTANGSSFTKGASNRLRLDAADLNFEPGVYTLFIEYMDYADNEDWKNVDRQTFSLEGSRETQP